MPINQEQFDAGAKASDAPHVGRAPRKSYDEYSTKELLAEFATTENENKAEAIGEILRQRGKHAKIDEVVAENIRRSRLAPI